MSYGNDLIEPLRWSAAVATIVAASLVSWRGSAELTASGFALFALAAIAWIVAGVVKEEPALVIQNVVLLGVNIFGIFRWTRRLGT